MPIVVRDLVPAFLDFWAQAADATTSQQQALWRAYTADHPEVVNDLVRIGADTVGSMPAPATYAALLPRIITNAPVALDWLEGAAAEVTQVLDRTELSITCVSMVGLAGSNGWVTVFDGSPTVFLAVEQIPGPDAGRILAAHEIAHACQWPEDGPIGRRTFAEGFATQLTAELMPQHPLAKHLWFDDGYEGWLADCQQALPRARHEIAAAAARDDHAATARYFMGGGGSDLPDRIGYLVGVRMIQELRRTCSWPELARWTPEQAIAHTAGT